MGLKTVFFGSPKESAIILRALNSSHHKVVAVVTAPDRPQGRGMEVRATAVKGVAQELGLPILQPPTLRSQETVADLAKLGAEVFVVAAYGLLLPETVLNTPMHGCVNVHFSLLPRWRGAAPVQWALMEGDEVTGVSIMRMDAGLDTGPVYARSETRIEPDDTTGTLMQRLTAMGAQLLIDVLDQIAQDTAMAEPQDEDRATLAPKIRPEQARLDWRLDAATLERKVRAMVPKPGAWTLASGKRLKVIRARRVDLDRDPGSLVSDDDGYPLVACGEDGLRLEDVQPEGKANMKGSDWLRGYRPSPNEVLA